MRAGKGNDKINVYEGSDLYDSDGIVDDMALSNNAATNYQGSLIYDGGEGDDEIWAFNEWIDDGGDL